jgi:sulfur carrier protein ThiS
MANPVIGSLYSEPSPVLGTGRRLGTHIAEAITAVNGSIAPRPEWHHGIGTAFGAVDWVHLFGSVMVHASRPLFRAAHCATTTAALGLVTEPSSLEKFLLPRCENELPPTLHAI